MSTVKRGGLRGGLAVGSVTRVSNITGDAMSECLGKKDIGRTATRGVGGVVRRGGCRPGLFTELGTGRDQVVKLAMPKFGSMAAPELMRMVITCLGGGSCAPLVVRARGSVRRRVHYVRQLGGVGMSKVVILTAKDAGRCRRTMGGLGVPVLFLKRHFPKRGSIVGSSCGTKCTINGCVKRHGFGRVCVL